MTDRDANGAEISDPEAAAIAGRYTDFCGYFAVDAAKMRVGTQRGPDRVDAMVSAWCARCRVWALRMLSVWCCVLLLLLRSVHLVCARCLAPFSLLFVAAVFNTNHTRKHTKQRRAAGLGVRVAPLPYDAARDDARPTEASLEAERARLQREQRGPERPEEQQQQDGQQRQGQQQDEHDQQQQQQGQQDQCQQQQGQQQQQQQQQGSRDGGDRSGSYGSGGRRLLLRGAAPR